MGILRLLLGLICCFLEGGSSIELLMRWLFWEMSKFLSNKIINLLGMFLILLLNPCILRRILLSMIKFRFFLFLSQLLFAIVFRFPFFGSVVGSKSLSLIDRKSISNFHTLFQSLKSLFSLISLLSFYNFLLNFYSQKFSVVLRALNF